MEWFLYRSGQVEGPLSQLELLTKINTGEINDDELMCRKGDEHWKTLKEFRPELIVKISDHAELQPHTSKEWILLVENMSLEDGELKQGQFVQNGPFTKEEVVDLIQTGKAKYSDYIWKSEFVQWSRINEVDEFFHSGTSRNVMDFIEPAEAVASDVEATPEALLENVLKQVSPTQHLDFVESFPEAMEPVTELSPQTEPLIVSAAAEEVEPVEEETAFTAAPSEEVIEEPEEESATVSEQPISLGAFTLSERLQEEPRKLEVTKQPLQESAWNFKKQIDKAAQGQLLPWVMLSLSLAMTGLFSVWYFTQEPDVAPSALHVPHQQNKNPDLQKPSINPKKENMTKEEPKTAGRTEALDIPAKTRVAAKKNKPVAKMAQKSKAASVAKKVASKPASKKVISSPVVEKIATRYQKKAELLDRQYARLKDRPFEWKRFYTNWKAELHQAEEGNLSRASNSALMRKLSLGKRRLVQRADMMDQSISSEKAVSSDFEEENIPQIFKNITQQARSKKQ
ncbi:MAG: GYF domain-containing protein [Bdellovibrionales bacterium]